MSTVTDCYDRLAEALGGHDVHPEDRQRIQQAYQEAGGPESAAWKDLPADVRQLVEEIEKSPAQSWDDPADVPDNLE